MFYFNENELNQLRKHVKRCSFWRPRIVKAILLELCNWRCKMCSSLKTSRVMLSTDEWIRILLQFIEQGAHEINFTGGEPTMHPGFEDILTALHSRNPALKTKLLTNATLLSCERVKMHRSLGLTRNIVSLHSHRPEVHDKIVGVSGQWNRTVAGITNLTTPSPEGTSTVWINCVVQSYNLSHLVEMTQLAAKLGCDGVSFSILDTRVADPGVPPITVRDMKHARSVLLPEVRRVAKELGIKLFPADLELFGVQDDELKRTAAGELSRGWYENHPCYWVFYHVTITSDGMIRPCGNRLMHRDYGNLRTHTAREILSGKSIIQFLGQMRERPAQIEACRGCEMKLQVNRSIHEAIAQMGGI